MTPVREASLEWGDERAINPWTPPDLLHIAFTGPQRRGEHRHFIDQAAQLVAAGSDGGAWQVRIRNIAPTGMQLLSDEPIVVPPDVRIRWNGREVRGVIRYNHKHGTGAYRIGVELLTRADELMREMLTQQTAELSDSNRALQWQARLAPQYASLLELTSEAILVLSPDGIVFFWNQAAERLYGWTRAEAIGRKFQQLVRTEPALNLADPQSITGDQTLRQVRKDGSAVDVCSRWNLQTDSSGNLEALVCLGAAQSRSSS
jgi:PAS domain S-box-containing protein